MQLLLFEAGIPLRRISGTKESAWSFHLGIGQWEEEVLATAAQNGGGGSNIRRFMEKDKDWTVFFAANFNRIGQIFQKQFTNSPQACNNGGWKDTRYCKKNPSYCVGKTRVCCELYMEKTQLDAKMYLDGCVAKTKVSAALKGRLTEPVCTMCNFLFELNNLPTVPCVNGTNPECAYLGGPNACGIL